MKALDAAKRLRAFMRELQAEGVEFDSDTSLWLSCEGDDYSTQLTAYSWDDGAIRVHQFNPDARTWGEVE